MKLLPYLRILLLSLVPFAGIRAQSDNFTLGSRAAAMGNAYVAESDIWSVQHNQAGLGWYNNLSLGFHHENRFIVPEYSLHAIALTLPSKPATIGISYSYFGYQLYNETKIGLGAGKSFGDKFSAGVQANLHYAYLEGDYGNRSALSIEGGIQYRPVQNLTIGAHIFNPTRARISAYQEDTIPTVFRTGFALRPSEKLCVSVETEKRLSPGMRFRAGLEYELMENLFIRTGILSNPFQSTFGLGYGIPRVSADLAFTRHQILGFTPHFTFRVRLKEPSEPQ